MCRALEPAIERARPHPRVRLRTLRRGRATPHAWAAADVPGSPFAVALDADGTVLAKGTFNTAAQLESVLATAERRRGAMRADAARLLTVRRRLSGAVPRQWRR